MSNQLGGGCCGGPVPTPTWLSLLRRASLMVTDRWPLSGFSEICRRLAAMRYPRLVCIDDFRGSGRFLCDLSEHMCSYIFWRGGYSLEQLALLERHLTRDATFVDVGANRGEFSIAAGLKVTEGQVLSFEPHPYMFEQLRRNILINEFENVQALQVGLADRIGEAQLFEAGAAGPDGSWNAGLGTIYGMRDREKSVATISLMPFDLIREELHVRRVDLMKIDVEGAELAVLRGAADAIAECRPIILIELNGESCKAAGYSTLDLVQWLKQRNYDIRLVDRELSLPRLEVPRPFCNAVCFP